MKTWTRTAPLSSAPQSQHREVWEYVDGGTTAASFEVDVKVGKPLDVLGLKGTSLEDISAYASFLKTASDSLYGRSHSTSHVGECPCCGADSSRASDAVKVIGVLYRRCWQCSHVFVGSQPTTETLAQYFTESEEHSMVYTDRDSVELRLGQVIEPKLDWVAETYYERCGRPLRSVLDVGAGGGHFVEACRRAGLEAEGYEISEASMRFAKDVFGIDLRNTDFLDAESPSAQFDVITFWGLLEYTPHPRDFIRVARRMLDPDCGMLVVEVPRFDCLSTAIQSNSSSVVARHLDPTSHVNLFSDASLATALRSSGFKPVAAWYFGMDAYELLVQLAIQLAHPEMMARLAPLIPGLQACLDSAELCDDIIVAAVPIN